MIRGIPSAASNSAFMQYTTNSLVEEPGFGFFLQNAFIKDSAVPPNVSTPTQLHKQRVLRVAVEDELFI